MRRQNLNPELASGEVEVFAEESCILTTAKTPPSSWMTRRMPARHAAR